MEKILDLDFKNALIDTLKEAGILDKVAHDIVEKRYKAALKKAAIERLKQVTHLIIEDKYDEAAKFIDDSPAGDGYGSDNSYINFRDITPCEDIGDIIYHLTR